MTNQPNVVILITDDQGYADLGCTGNPWIQTPHVDAFYTESVRCTDFHVSPLCTPTRGALMTGRRPVRNGAWATCWGRSILGRDEVTMADIFAANGYRTALFGKWHLGDNYPYRPFDRGFEHVVAHKGGGVGQTPDFWGNNYFDDTYFHNGSPMGHEGYCTDVWFDEALNFITTQKENPFFAVISTNAPHSPYLVAERYQQLYAKNPEIVEPAFYGMITNIDENFGRLRQTLQELALEEQTILIFMTDNGSSGGCQVDGDHFVTRGYNAGLRGKKGSYYDGGHRAPFFVRWPQGGLTGGQDRHELALHIDLLPTLIDLCALTNPFPANFDGESLAPLLRGEIAQLPGDRIHFIQYRQDTCPPDMWENGVITRRWRLVQGRELYDIQADPGQVVNVADQHPQVVTQLRAAHEGWWAEIEPGLNHYTPIVLGHPAENPTRLCAMDVMGDVAWSQAHIVMAQSSTGRWTVDVDRAGQYRFSLRRWPAELGLPLNEALTDTAAGQIAPYQTITHRGVIQPAQARLILFGQTYELPALAHEPAVTFDLTLTQTGITELEAWFVDQEGKVQGAYYVYVERQQQNPGSIQNRQLDQEIK